MSDELPPMDEFMDEYSSKALVDGHVAAWRHLATKYIDRLAAVRFLLVTSAYGLMVYGLDGLTIRQGPFRSHTVGLGEAIMFSAVVLAVMWATWRGLEHVWP